MMYARSLGRTLTAADSPLFAAIADESTQTKTESARPMRSRNVEVEITAANREAPTIIPGVLLRVFGIERNVRAAGFEHGEESGVEPLL
jgi:hypothetical protein